MSSYTMPIREIIGNFYTREEVEKWFMDYDLSDYLTPTQIQTIQDTGIWSKEKLARKIVDHYFFQEIGFETFGQFKQRVKVKMQELMEEKLPIIYTNAIQYDPLINVDYTEQFTRNIDSEGQNSGSSNSNSKNNGSGLTVNSDTPQGEINKTKILNGEYASSTTASESENEITDSTQTSGEATNSTLETYTRHMRGNSGISATYQKMIEQFRDNIIAIDRDIINNLSDLFMVVF